MTAFSIREGGPADLDPIAEVEVASWTATGLRLPDDLDVATERELLAAALARGMRLFVAETDGRVVGFMLLDNDRRYLAALFVTPERQRSGIGRALLRLARDQLPEGLWLRTPANNSLAIDWYEREGFAKEREAAHELPPHRLMAYFRWVPPKA